MTTATLDTSIDAQIGGPVYKAVVGAVEKCITMCGCRARVVGVTTVPSHEPGHVTGIIGVHGKVSGFCTVNMAERFAIRAVSGLLQDEQTTLTAQVVDGVGEITNIIVGGVKGALANTAWSFPQITVPSVIVGDGYRMAFAKGLEYLCVVFENDDPEAVMLDHRLMQVSVSLLKL
jgi:chemotaxis protein CheX